jgi:RND superfamily putative drug exporter
MPSDQIDDPARDELAATAQPARDAGLQVEFGGGIVTDSSKSNSETFGLMIGFVVLAITLGSLLAAGLPLVTAIIGVLLGVTGLTALTGVFDVSETASIATMLGVTGLTALTGVFDVSETASILATMLGLAVGIDYALFILSRHRQNLGEGLEPAEAAAQATATAGSAVVFAGMTVVIALVGLTVVNIPFLTVMGLAAAATVTIAVLIALTLLPAILGFAGSRLARVNRVLGLRPRRARTSRANMGTRWARFVTSRPLAALLVSLAVLAPSRSPRCT